MAAAPGRIRATSERASFAEIRAALWGSLYGRGDPAAGQLLLRFEQCGCGEPEYRSWASIKPVF